MICCYKPLFCPFTTTDEEEDLVTQVTLLTLLILPTLPTLLTQLTLLTLPILTWSPRPRSAASTG